jgi:hypothetical protein
MLLREKCGIRLILITGAVVFLIMVGMQVFLSYAIPMVKKASGEQLYEDRLANAEALAELQEDLVDLESDRRMLQEFSGLALTQRIGLRRHALISHARFLVECYNEKASTIGSDVLSAEALPEQVEIIFSHPDLFSVKR